MECICSDIVDIIGNFKYHRTAAASKDQPGSSSHPNGDSDAVNDQNESLASSWLNEISSVISEELPHPAIAPIFEQTPSAEHAQGSENAAFDRNLSFSPPQESVSSAASTILQCLSPVEFLKSAFDDYTVESLVRHKESAVKSGLLDILQKYISFTMPAFPPIKIRSSMPMQSMCSDLAKGLHTPSALEGNLACPPTRSLSLVDFYFSTNGFGSKEEILLIKSFFLYVICFHMLIFNPIPADVKPFMVPLMESIMSGGSFVNATHFQYTFPFQFSAIYSLEANRIGSSFARKDCFDPELKLFINPLIGLLLRCKPGLCSPSDSVCDSSFASQKTSNPVTLSSNVPIHSVFLEHSDASSIFESEFNYALKLDQICTDNSLVKCPEYNYACQGVERFKVTCRWLNMEFLGEGATNARAKEHSAKLAFEYYQKNPHLLASNSACVSTSSPLSLAPSNSLSLAPTSSLSVSPTSSLSVPPIFSLSESMLKNLDSLNRPPETFLEDELLGPSFSPLRKPNLTASPFQFEGGKKTSQLVTATNDPSFPSSAINVLCADDFLKYSQYFMDLYKKSVADPSASKMASETPDKAPLATSPLGAATSDAVLKSLPSMLPRLNGDKKYISLIMEYCQMCRVPYPEFKFSSHTAPFSGRCQWLGQSFLTGYASELKDKVFHHKKSDAKERLAKIAFSYLLVSTLIDENTLTHLKALELLPFLDKNYLVEKYHQFSLSSLHDQDKKNQGTLQRMPSDLNEQRVSRYSSRSTSRSSSRSFPKSCSRSSSTSSSGSSSRSSSTPSSGSSSRSSYRPRSRAEGKDPSDVQSRSLSRTKSSRESSPQRTFSSTSSRRHESSHRSKHYKHSKE